MTLTVSDSRKTTHARTNTKAMKSFNLSFMCCDHHEHQEDHDDRAGHADNDRQAVLLLLRHNS